eukprot:5483-Heterococcus_DN1.PRE.1
MATVMTQELIVLICITRAAGVCFTTLTDCAVCADGYSKSIGFECSECETGTEAGIYTALAALLSVLVTGFVFLIQQLLGLDERKTDQQVKAKPPGCCMNIKLPSCCNFKLPNFCHLSLPGLLLKMFKMLASLPWSKLRVPIVAFQIVTQYINITGFPLPDIYRKFLAWTDAFNLNLGWLLSLGCLTRVNFYQKLLIITIGPFIAM